jgi:hypothetical protein
MTKDVIQLPRDRHRDLKALLPWYAADRLAPAERAEVWAHLNHCAECQAEMRDEPALAAQIADLPIGLPALDVEHGWAAINGQLEDETPRRAPSTAWIERLFAQHSGRVRPTRLETGWLGWAVAAQFCLILVMGAAIWRVEQPARYHALGAAPASPAANLVVIFRPETPEKDLREILRSNDARLVDGPTETDAYLLHVPAAGRPAALARLRRQAQVILAEPVDAR